MRAISHWRDMSRDYKEKKKKCGSLAESVGPADKGLIALSLSVCTLARRASAACKGPYLPKGPKNKVHCALLLRTSRSAMLFLKKCADR